MTDARAVVPIARPCQEALETFIRLRGGGMARDEALALLEQGLRAALPGDTRDEAILLDCLACRDTGFEPIQQWSRIYQGPIRKVRFCSCNKGRGHAEAYHRHEAQRSGPQRRGDLTALAAFTTRDRR